MLPIPKQPVRTTFPRLLLLAGVLIGPAVSSALAVAAVGGDGASMEPGMALHLEDALAIARRRNWELLSAVTDSAVAVAGVRTADEHFNPALSVLTSHIHTDALGDGTDLGNDLWSRDYDSVAQLSQTIELPGKRRARHRSAVAAAEGARDRLADTRRNLEADVVRAYVGAAFSDAQVRIAEESASYLRDEARIAEVRWQAGDISRSDLDQIEIAAARLDLDARNAEGAALQQRLALEVLLGARQPAGDIVVADSLETLADRAPTSGAPSTGLRPDLAAAQADVRRTESDWRLERAQRIPDPTLLIQAEHEPPLRPNTLGLGISLPLPLWNRNAGAIAAARASHDRARREAARVEAAVTADITAARAVLDEASARWRRYRDDLRPRSEAIRRSVSLAYEKGGASLLDLLQAQRSDNDVRLATMQAASDAALAAAELRSAVTTIVPENRP
jgi:cobalt-zinc-cadmium efflux system outer membrane protein